MPSYKLTADQCEFLEAALDNGGKIIRVYIHRNADSFFQAGEAALPEKAGKALIFVGLVERFTDESSDTVQIDNGYHSYRLTKTGQSVAECYAKGASECI